MNDSTIPVCPTCGRPLPGGENRLCAACLLTEAMQGDSSPLSEEPGLDETQPQDVGALLVAVEEEDAVALPTPGTPHAFGGYRLLKVLGRGGMGVVYEAEQVATGRRVALKMLGQQFDSPETRRRFLREGRLAAGVSHPNSVYVFGTEEIEGLPVITMEVASGGTLQDRLDRRGPMPVIESVDAMLDVIDGLEAALMGDVLHRDIKPSNCFVDPDGRVKVCDFGLSVSTVSSVDTFATATGVALGTPAFASPEQLRSDDLDHRSDIYAVGSTLFTVLAGHQPFVGNNAVRIVAAVLDEIPKSLDTIREDVPPELAAVVAKCLAKKAEARYVDYASLRVALIPFSSRQPEPEPAPILRRTLAAMIDQSIAWLVPRTLAASSAGALYFGELWQTPWYWIYTTITMVWFLIYFGVGEGLYGAAIGKRLLSLTVSTSQGRRPGVRRSLLRALMSLLALQGMLLLLIALALGWLPDDLAPTTYGILFGGSMLVFMLLPLITMRLRNGYATVWDMLTRTRVVMMPANVPALSVAVFRDDAPVDDVGAASTMIGPYSFVRTIRDGDWIEAKDTELGRLIWLRQRTGASLDESRRDVSRPTRLRWLQSVHTEEEVWDAFEAKPGFPLRAVVKGCPADWQAVRHWLHDLSLELASGEQDGSLPAQLGLDHVWITTTGHTVLLDEAYHVDEDETKLIDVSGAAGCQSFLSEVASTAEAHSIPVHAKGVLEKIAAGSFSRLSFLAGNLRSLLTKPARIDRGSRATALLTVPLFLMASGLISEQATEQTYRTAADRWLVQFPDQPPLSEVLRHRDSIVQQTGDHRAIGVHLAGHYAGLGDDTGSSEDSIELPATLGDIASIEYFQQAIESAPEFSAEELDEADQEIREAITGNGNETGFRLDSDEWLRGIASAVSLGVFTLCVIGLLQLPALALFACTLGQILYGYAVVDDGGHPAGRLRLLIRWAIVWTPVVGILLLGLIQPVAHVLILPWLVGVVAAIMRPQRGWQESWTGTWLVPR